MRPAGLGHSPAPDRRRSASTYPCQGHDRLPIRAYVRDVRPRGVALTQVTGVLWGPETSPVSPLTATPSHLTPFSPPPPPLPPPSPLPPGPPPLLSHAPQSPPPPQPPPPPPSPRPPPPSNYTCPNRRGLILSSPRPRRPASPRTPATQICLVFCFFVVIFFIFWFLFDLPALDADYRACPASVLTYLSPIAVPGFAALACLLPSASHG